MSFNPYQTTAENQAFIMNRYEQATAKQADSECYSHAIVSQPNGQQYGVEGHIPCDHHAFFYYNDGTVRQFSTDRAGASIWKTVQ